MQRRSASTIQSRGKQRRSVARVISIETKESGEKDKNIVSQKQHTTMLPTLPFVFRPVVSFSSVLPVSRSQKKQVEDIFALNDKGLASHITVIAPLRQPNSFSDKKSHTSENHRHARAQAEI